MTPSNNLRHLLRLLDDESPTVRAVVLRELRRLEPNLHDSLAHLAPPPTEEQRELLGQLLNTRLSLPPRSEKDGPEAFFPGQLVQHRRYGYRGVVVERDARCEADDEWYQSNATQPSRNQPWYYVLVHNTPHVTYAAHTSLLPDPSCKQVEHPLVPFFFHEFQNGSYFRNDRRWLKE